MMRFLIRIAALVIIVGSIYAVRNLGKDSQFIKKSAIKTTELLEEKSNTEEEVSIEDIKDFTKKDILVKTKNSLVVKSKNDFDVVNTQDKIETITEKKEAVLPKSDATVYMYDFEIDLSTKTFPAGDITFTVKNSGLFAHQFAIEGVKNYGLVGRDATEVFTVRITKPGTYKVSSEKEMDIEREMYEYITVE